MLEKFIDACIQKNYQEAEAFLVNNPSLMDNCFLIFHREAPINTEEEFAFYIKLYERFALQLSPYYFSYILILITRNVTLDGIGLEVISQRLTQLAGLFPFNDPAHIAYACLRAARLEKEYFPDVSSLWIENHGVRPWDFAIMYAALEAAKKEEPQENKFSLDDLYFAQEIEGTEWPKFPKIPHLTHDAERRIFLNFYYTLRDVNDEFCDPSMETPYTGFINLQCIKLINELETPQKDHVYELFNAYENCLGIKSYSGLATQEVLDFLEKFDNVNSPALDSHLNLLCVILSFNGTEPRCPNVLADYFMGCKFYNYTSSLNNLLQYSPNFNEFDSLLKCYRDLGVMFRDVFYDETAAETYFVEVFKCVGILATMPHLYTEKTFSIIQETLEQWLKIQISNYYLVTLFISELFKWSNETVERVNLKYLLALTNLGNRNHHHPINSLQPPLDLSYYFMELVYFINQNYSKPGFSTIAFDTIPLFNDLQDEPKAALFERKLNNFRQLFKRETNNKLSKLIGNSQGFSFAVVQQLSTQECEIKTLESRVKDLEAQVIAQQAIIDAQTGLTVESDVKSTTTSPIVTITQIGLLKRKAADEKGPGLENNPAKKAKLPESAIEGNRASLQ